jgi:hypothetical protein
MFLDERKVVPELHLTGGEKKAGDDWYLDNGASNHMSGVADMFQNLDTGVVGKVRFGDGSTVEIKGRGTLVFQCKNGDQWLLPDVYYIPSLRSNLISLGQLTETGHRVVMDDDWLEVVEKSGQKLILRVDQATNRLYSVVLKNSQPVCLLTKMSDDAWLWHSRLGHAGFHTLKQLSEKSMVGGVPAIDHPEEVCEACLAGKQTRMSFPKKSQWHAGRPLELLHVDLCGPITPATAGGNRYFMLTDDDCSRMMSLFMLKSKDEATSICEI